MDFEELKREAEEGERWRASLPLAVNLRTASMMREVKPLLKTARQRELAEEIASVFEQRAVAQLGSA
jgi:hypothetical protein